MSSSLQKPLCGAGFLKRHPQTRMTSLFGWQVLACSILVVSAVLPIQAIGQDEIKLTAKPDSCVALHRGQPCFSRVQLSWTGPMDSDVCLYSNNDEVPFLCLSGNTRQVSVDYASGTSTLYSMRFRNAEQVLAEVVVRTAWVYRTGRRSSSGWRLF